MIPPQRQGALLGSAANHLSWYLQKFVPWAAKQGLVGADAMESLAGIPCLTVKSRTIRIPSVDVVGDFLKMVESEDPDGGAYLRFLTTSEVRLSGGIGLRWKDVDFAAVQMSLLQKGGKRKIIPMTAEAVAALSLLSGFTVQEVAKLLGHSDNGVLVLKTITCVVFDRWIRHLAYILQSTDLGSPDPWTEVTGESYVNDTETVSYTLPAGGPARIFLRLQVTSE